MGVASMIIGIVSLGIGFIPMCGFWAAAPAVVGLILGIVDLAVKSKRKQPRGKAIAGVILNPLAIVVIVAWYVLFVYGSEMAADQMITGYGQGWQQPPPGWQVGPSQGPVPLQPTPQPVPLQPMQPMEPMQPVPPDPGAPQQPAAPPPPPPPPAATP